MQYIHVALALHSAGKEINLANIQKMLKSVGADVDDGQIKALVAVLDGVDIDEAVKSAPVGRAVATPAAPAADSGASPSTDKEEETEESGDDMGLDSLFG